MAKTRALLTETEREQIAGDHGDDRRYQATSRVRRRLNEELTTDVAVLADHHPDLLAELRGVVCGEHAAESHDAETRLKRLSDELEEPITVGETVYEDGDAHPLDDSPTSADAGEHNLSGPERVADPADDGDSPEHVERDEDE